MSSSTSTGCSSRKARGRRGLSPSGLTVAEQRMVAQQQAEEEAADMGGGRDDRQRAGRSGLRGATPISELQADPGGGQPKGVEPVTPPRPARRTRPNNIAKAPTMAETAPLAPTIGGPSGSTRMARPPRLGAKDKRSTRPSGPSALDHPPAEDQHQHVEGEMHEAAIDQGRGQRRQPERHRRPSPHHRPPRGNETLATAATVAPGWVLLSISQATEGHPRDKADGRRSGV